MDADLHDTDGLLDDDVVAGFKQIDSSGAYYKDNDMIQNNSKNMGKLPLIMHPKGLTQRLSKNP